MSSPAPWATAALMASVTASPSCTSFTATAGQQHGQRHVDEDRPQQQGGGLPVEGLDDPEQQQGDDDHAGQRGHGLVVGGEPRRRPRSIGSWICRTLPIWAEQPRGAVGHPARRGRRARCRPRSPATWEAAEPTGPADRSRRAPGTPGPSPSAPSAAAADGQESPGMAGTRHGQCTPWPALKKKFTMPGPAPISRAASPETRRPAGRRRTAGSSGRGSRVPRPPPRSAGRPGTGPGPSLQAVHEVLEDLASGELARVRAMMATSTIERGATRDDRRDARCMPPQVEVSGVEACPLYEILFNAFSCFSFWPSRRLVVTAGPRPAMLRR